MSYFCLLFDLCELILGLVSLFSHFCPACQTSFQNFNLLPSEYSPCLVVHRLVDARQRIRIFGTHFVKDDVVSANAPFPIGLSHHDYVGQLGQVSDFSNKLGFKRLVNLFSNHLM